MLNLSSQLTLSLTLALFLHTAPIVRAQSSEAESAACRCVAQSRPGALAAGTQGRGGTGFQTRAFSQSELAACAGARVESLICRTIQRKFSIIIKSRSRRSICEYISQRPSGDTLNPRLTGFETGAIGVTLPVAKSKNLIINLPDDSVAAK